MTGFQGRPIRLLVLPSKGNTSAFPLNVLEHIFLAPCNVDAAGVLVIAEQLDADDCS